MDQGRRAQARSAATAGKELSPCPAPRRTTPTNRHTEPSHLNGLPVRRPSAEGCADPASVASHDALWESAPRDRWMQGEIVHRVTPCPHRSRGPASQGRGFPAPRVGALV